MQIQENELIN